MFNPTKDLAFALTGGYDQISSHLSMSPGGLIGCSNVEMVAGKSGYGRAGAYERCSNDVLPSKTNVEFFEISSITGAISIDDEFTDGTVTVKALEAIASPLDGDILAVATHNTSFTLAATYTKSGNAFDLDSVLADTSAYTQAEIQAFTRLAIEQTRDAIPQVTGTGDINGGFRLNSKNYCFRGGKLYEGGSYAWTEIVMPHVLYFDAGSVELTVGAILSDSEGTPATGTIKSVTVQTGAWGDSDAAGYVTLTIISGTFTDDSILFDDESTPGAAVANGVNAAHTLLTTGKYETVEYNFTNLVDNESAYGVSGVEEAFEFDGTNYIPIFVLTGLTGEADTDIDNIELTNDTPLHINIHQHRLQLHYPGGQMLYSVSGEPRSFDPILGAGTYSTGSEIVGAKTIHNNAEAIFCKDSTWMLLGDGVYSTASATRNWQFFEHDDDVGAMEWSIAGRSYPVFMSSAEILRLLSTDTSAGYIPDNVAAKIQPLLDDKSKNTTVVGALWARNKSQYRVFFADGTAIFITFENGVPKGATPINIPDGVINVWSSIEDGKEYLFFTSDTGYLYRMDSGNTADDGYIEGSFRLPFYHYGSPRIEKIFPQMILELDSPVLLTEDTEITFTVNHNYGSPNSPRPIAETVDDIEGSGSLYDSGTYGNFVWSGQLVTEIHGYLDGYGSNMSILVTFKTKYDSSFTFLTAIVDYIELGRKEQG